MNRVNSFYVRRWKWILILCLAMAGSTWCMLHYQSRFVFKRVRRFVIFSDEKSTEPAELSKLPTITTTTTTTTTFPTTSNATLTFSDDTTTRIRMKSNRIPLAFRPKMNVTEKSDMLALLRTFDRVARANNLSYFLYGGSLLGAYRHGGVIPWDDDLDVVMHIRERDSIEDLLRRLNGYDVWHFRDKKRRIKQWKFFSATARKLKNFPWTWPFMDIFSYDENSTHIWVDDIFGKVYCAKDLVFPLKNERFEDLVITVPKNVKKYLSQLFKSPLSKCSSGYWSHKYERAL